MTLNGWRFSSPKGAALTTSDSTTVFAVIVVWLSGLVACTDGAGPEPHLTTLSGRIVFQSNRSGSFHVWSMRPDGSDMDRLTDDTMRVGAPAVSPDGRTLLVSDGAQILGIDVATRRVRVVAPLAGVIQLDWGAANGLILATWVNPGNGSHDISSVNPTTGVVTPLVGTVATESNADWSPDGQWVAFESDAASENGLQLYVIRANGTGLRRITTMDDVVDVGARWSPDGSQIAFRRLGAGLSERLGLVTPAGDDTTFVPGINDLQTVGFSPDGTEFVVDRNTPDGRTIWRLKADGSALRQLTAEALDVNPRWIP